MRLRALAPLAALLALGGCAYFNGVYNAKEAARHADKEARSGREGQAQGQYRIAAEKAETVLVRYPKSRWRADALYLAGRGHAFSGQCDLGVPRLTEFLSLDERDSGRRQLASLALGSCLVQQQKYSDARTLLEPLTDSREREVSFAAALWAARASMALGDNDGAQRYLARVDAAAAQWELAASSLARAEYARAESLLTIRALRGDYRDELLSHLDALWIAGRHESVERLVAVYAASRQRASVKARLHMYAAELHMGAHRDSLARAHLMAARRISTDTLVDREAVARLALLSFGTVATSDELVEVLARAQKQGQGSPLMVRIHENVQLMRRLESNTDRTGASLFLAAEVSRDSLRAPRLAHEQFRAVERRSPESIVVPKALLAAAALAPDSAAAYAERLRGRFPGLLGATEADHASDAMLAEVDDLLRDTWTRVTTEHAAELARQRAGAAGSPATAAGSAGGTPPSGAND